MQRLHAAVSVRVAERLARVLVRTWWIGMMTLPACVSPSRVDLPNDGPFAPEHALQQGTATGDVSSDTAVIWTRTKETARVQVEWGPEAEDNPRGTFRSPVVITTPMRDYTAAILLEDLHPATAYQYRILTSQRTEEAWEPRASGRFRTAASAQLSESVRFAWSADLGGQQHCRRETDGYAIFERMRQVKPVFVLLLGDLIYADDRCMSPPNAPGSDFIAATLDEFRAKHRYQREDEAVRRFLAEVPVYATWDDHEVRNNFSGPADPLMPIGRQAFLEYWPIRTPPDDPSRLYRRIRRGADLEVYILDTRQYRSRNGEMDGKEKTMLGSAQRDWLIEGLTGSTATWKVIATSVPLSLLKEGTVKVPGNDSWARAEDGTGFQTELRLILDAVKSRGVRNVVWLAADVHFAQVNEYDPDGDGEVDFHEFVAGPLSAARGQPRPPEPSLHPHTLYSDGGFLNFGLIEVAGPVLRLAIIGETGTTRFAHTVTAK